MSTVLAKMAVQISANTAEFNKALQSTSSNLKNFTSGLTKIAGTVGLAFSAQQVASFALEVAKLSGEAEAVRIAFDRLPNSIKLMNQLKEATGGTVSELELMKRAVQASNFDISLEALPRLLQFATLRAQQTGQSVDYLVDSIVTGIGRKSKLILDNLGISAAQLSEELHGVSAEASTVGEVADAVGRIAEKNLANMAGFAETTSTAMQRLSASWGNLKVAMGDVVNESGLVERATNSLSSVFDVMANRTLSFADKLKLLASINGEEKLKAIKEEATKAAEALDILVKHQADQAIETFGFNLKAIGDAYKQNINYTAIMAEIQVRYNKQLDEANKSQANAIDTIAEIEERIKALNESYKNIDITKTAELIQNRKLVKSYEEQIEALKRLGEAKLKAVQVPNFGSSLSHAAMPGFKPKEDIRNQGFLQGVGELVPPDISRFKETAKEIDSINRMLSQSFADMASSTVVSMAYAFGSGESIGKSFLGAINQFMRQFAQQLVAIGAGKVALGIGTRNPKMVANGFAMIGAAAALGVAAGAASRGASSSNGGLVGSSGGGTIGSTRSLATNSAQNEFSYETVIRGQDLYVILSNYQRNRNRTSAIGG